MPATIPPPTPDLDALLEALDAADTAVRALYRNLADDPDLAPAYETTLRELHARRTELARQVGMAALAARRAPPVEANENAACTTGPAEPCAPPAVDPEPGPNLQTGSPVEPPPPVPAQGEPTPAVVAADAPPPPVPPPPASDAQLAQWRDAVSSKGLGAALPPAPTAQRPWGINLHEMMCLLGPPDVDLNDSAAVLDELDALEAVATEERQKLWVRFPIDVQKHWLSHLVARTRTLREHSASEGVMDRLKAIRAVYPQWTRDYVPGHIHGLQLKHAPVGGTWVRDAEDHWRALGEALGPDVARRVVRSAPKKRKPERSVVEEEPAVVPPDWPLLPVVRGKVAVLVGGVPKEPNRERLEAYLRLATLEWPLVDGPRKVAAVAQRIARGAYDLVVVNQALISHPEAEQVLGAAKASRTRWAVVDGYGVMAVQQGIERFLHAPGETAKH